MGQDTIAFARVHETSKGGRSIVFSVRPDGTRLSRLTDSEGWDSYPAWSPDGDRLLFMRTVQRSSDMGDMLMALFLVTPDGMELTQVTHNGWMTLHPKWSPSGRQIVFASSVREPYYNLYVLNLDRSTIVKITHGPPSKEMPAWSPDGALIAYVSPIERRTDDSGHTVGHAIRVMSVDGTWNRQLTEGEAKDLTPTWSPDGERILFTRSLDQERVIFPTGGFITARAIYVMNKDGSQTARVTSNERTSYESPTWSPDGARLACSKDEGWGKHICVMNTDGTSQRAITNPAEGADDDPSWGVPG